jgi:predicted ATPase
LEITQERADEPELLRLMGCIAVACSLADGEGYIRRAMELASRRHARLLELRAATSLARLWVERGERRRALQLLAPAHGWFTEGLNTPDVRDAKELLDGLR